MSITIHVYYNGKDGGALTFAKEMTSCGIVDAIRSKDGNLQYDYFLPLDGGDTVLLVDRWRSQKDLDEHHHSEIMSQIVALRGKYHLTMHVDRFISDPNGIPDKDKQFIQE